MLTELYYLHGRIPTTRFWCPFGRYTFECEENRFQHQYPAVCWFLAQLCAMKEYLNLASSSHFHTTFCGAEPRSLSKLFVCVRLTPLHINADNHLTWSSIRGQSRAERRMIAEEEGVVEL